MGRDYSICVSLELLLAWPIIFPECLNIKKTTLISRESDFGLCCSGQIGAAVTAQNLTSCKLEKESPYIGNNRMQTNEILKLKCMNI